MQEKVLYVTCEQECFKISKDQWEDIVNLKSSKEEADTCMLLHALHVGMSGYKAVVIIAEDIGSVYGFQQRYLMPQPKVWHTKSNKVP